MSGTPNTAYDGPELFCKNCGSMEQIRAYEIGMQGRRETNIICLCKKCAGLFEDIVASRSREAVRS